MTNVARILTGAPIGFNGSVIEVESDTTKGLPNLLIVGLGNKAIDEARERVKSAIANSMLEYPSRRITINLAPAELPKDGSHYDLPIALSILVGSGQLQQEEVAGALFAGELALDGSLRPIRGAISLAQLALNSGLAKLYLPVQNVQQAQLVKGIEIIGVTSLKSLFLHLKGEMKISTQTPSPSLATSPGAHPLLDDIYGQEQAKRALIVAAAGHHNLLLNGTPGSGKTMMARALMNLLLPLENQEMIDVTKIASLAGETIDSIVTSRPFRAPHHTASRTSLIGGGTKPRPGAISLAHHGVLFLDELPEYPRSSLEALRQPLEDRMITISRADGHVTYPANFMLVATMNPCPCGYFGDSSKECTCTSTQILAYQKKLSGPLLDRVDMTVNVSRVPSDSILEESSNNKQHLHALDSIKNAASMQQNRFESRVIYNSTMDNSAIKKQQLSSDVKNILATASDKLQLSARSYLKIIKISRTIADLEQSPDIKTHHVTEALQYRQTS